MPSFHSLPAEVIEHILIIAALGGFPQAIAAFARTCKANYSLVYNSPDQHLWRQIYLTTFDDPRASGGGPGWGDCASSHNHPQDDFEWAHEYQERAWAAEYIRHQTDPTYRLSAVWHTDEEVTHRNIRAFDALLSVIDSALPCPPTIVLSFLGGGVGAPSPPSPTYDQYPIFPPLPQAMGGSSSIVAISPSDVGGRTFGQATRARNTAWVESVLAKGYPPEVTADFSGEKWVGRVFDQLLDPAEFRQMQAAGQLIAYTGFMPIPQPLADVVSVPGSHTGDRQYMSAENQLRRARRLARQRVYNMRYLSRDRHWGPFLPVESPKEGRRRDQRVVEDEELLQPILAMIHAAAAHPHGNDHNHDHDHDQEHDDEHEDESEHGDAGENDIMDVDEDEDAEGDASSTDSEDDRGLPDAREAEADIPTGPPTSSELRTDWAYLAAVRVVVEANLRQSVQNLQDLRGLLSLDGLRPGSAPWDASAYKVPDPPEESSSKGKGKERATASDECEGWDWAGVTGIWQRCVCWMDYRDLILHNLSGEFEDPHLSEAVRIIAMRLRIQSYSPCTVPGYEHLPTIHVIGETVRGAVSGRPRKMHGTVSIVADGSVRWNLYSTIEGGDEDEWVSEGVQVGGVASAMGILGLWTGAQHERMDPLGPCWAWKVA
ncbi:hypothetical protein L226DRAFT_541096 [Lentinus tigrinus ALCF2SS1-7]|uniref:F-box domain-containing protein n=1 Tax=Lentinus tigrinus ALCF2SS1-6 TaxID=1328759 RepID=A0A5C2RPV4_9APHY|nr:hypothetical protein L227DRAFT_582041 [Lentinus tigrinus ALCF2SS1-6]RPD67971.1 hypothetical protein L226DRAFT_541096 [Lentinus tigrinus ALCF2SS1-7]